MSRRRAASKRKILSDPKFGSQSIARFINQVMVSGKKNVAEKIVYGAMHFAMDKLKGELKQNQNQKEGDLDNAESGSMALIIFEKVLENLQPIVEVRSRRVGGATYQVPVEVRASRRSALAMRWLVESAKGRSEKTMALRLGAEMVDAYHNRGTAIKKREDTHRMAEANKAFAHYRW